MLTSDRIREVRKARAETINEFKDSVPAALLVHLSQTVYEPEIKRLSAKIDLAMFDELLPAINEKRLPINGDLALALLLSDPAYTIAALMVECLECKHNDECSCLCGCHKSWQQVRALLEQGALTIDQVVKAVKISAT